MSAEERLEVQPRVEAAGVPAGPARLLKYLARRLAAILVTILIGVFVTIVVGNHGGLVDSIARTRVSQIVAVECISRTCSAEDRQQLQEQFSQAYGLQLSYLPRHLLWTVKALALDWGEVSPRSGFRALHGDYENRLNSRLIILQHLPNTLLLIGCSYLLLFTIGIPLALHLSQGRNRPLDRLIAVLTPLSSIPAWVLGILLVLVFAVELRLLPAGGMNDSIISSNLLARLFDRARHMVLPVLAIVLSMIFQLVYSWRTFFLTYSDDDYVELARAKGLPDRLLQRSYILRPGLPYVVTSFSLTLVAFWQSMTALEYTFGWRGIGNLYVRALPNYTGESFYPGEISIVIGIVVIFAYLLGLTVFLLDIFYVLVDPRLQVGSPRATVRLVTAARRGLAIRAGRHPKRWKPPNRKPVPSAAGARRPPGETQTSVQMARQAHRTVASKRFFRQLVRSPGGLVGLILIGLMVFGSIYVVLALPYGEIGRSWYLSNLGGKPVVPALAQPVWVNWFRRSDLPLTITLDTRAGNIERIDHPPASGMFESEITFHFDYPYNEFPQDAVIYFYPRYNEKSPFVAVNWITPDGRQYELDAASATPGSSYRLGENIPHRRIVAQNPRWQQWFVFGGNYPTPPLRVLFADPDSNQAVALEGPYRLQLRVLTFEPDSELDAQLVIFGQVHGLAGTDSMRRDLLVPLLWGLPIALTVGVFGALATTLCSLLAAAASVWMGGWMDILIERINEATIILPILAIAVLFYAFYGASIWMVLTLVILMNAFGSPTKAFRAAFLQIKESPYLEAARAYGAGDWRIIWRYLVPRILPMIVPQIITLIPSFVFLEATLAILGVSDPRYPSWGKVLYSALRYGASYGSRFWVLEPVALLLLTGFAFALAGYWLNNVFNPRLNIGNE